MHEFSIGQRRFGRRDPEDQFMGMPSVEKRAPDANTTYPACTDGQLACPPEDCGGIPGFYDLVEALNDPNHERHEEMLDWIGDDFDPSPFG
jgi:hypothetical protein